MAIYETYTVKSGDTLGGIAREQDTTVGELATLNGIADPDLISVGQILNIRRISETSYIVVRGDTLSAIAAHYGVSVSALVETNGIANPNLLSIGTVLRIPQGAPQQPVDAQTLAPSGHSTAGLPQPGAASLKAATLARNSVLHRSAGRCYKYVKRALLGSGAVSRYLGGGSAIEAGPELVSEGFVDILGMAAAGIKSPYDAPAGAVLV